jgi:hypothetical protein
MSNNEKLVHAYGNWLCNEIEDGWKGFFITFTFKQLKKADGPLISQMEDIVDRFYRNLVRRFAWRPKSQLHLLPRLNAFPDVPYIKNRKYQYRIDEVTVNGGLHVHGVLRIPEVSKFKGDLKHHLAEKAAVYVRYPLHNIDLQPITSRPDYVVGYGFKALKNGRIDPDHMMIWPKSVSELPPKGWLQERREASR